MESDSLLRAKPDHPTHTLPFILHPRRAFICDPTQLTGIPRCKTTSQSLQSGRGDIRGRDLPLASPRILLEVDLFQVSVTADLHSHM